MKVSNKKDLMKVTAIDFGTSFPKDTLIDFDLFASFDYILFIFQAVTSA